MEKEKIKQTKANKINETEVLKQIEASFCDIGIFDILESYIAPKKKALKEA